LSVRKYYKLFTHELSTFLLQNTPLQTLVQWGQTTRKSTLPLEAHGTHLIHQWLAGHHSPSQTTARSVYALLHNYATTSPLVTMGRPKFTPQNCPSLQRSPSYLTHLSLDRPHSPSQTASGSNQPFCRSTISGQTDRPTHTQTDRWARRQVRK